MDILTSKCSDRFMAHVLKRRDQEAVRWYVLTLPTAGGGRDKINPSKGLASWGDAVRVFRPFICRGEESGRQDGQHETAPAVQLRVHPRLGERDL